MPSEKPLRRLEDILENIARIEQFTAAMAFDSFAKNDQAVYASLYALPIISEAARKPGAAAEFLVPSQPWPEIRGIGNVLRHDYDGVDPNTVWRIVASGDLASLREAVGEAVAALRREL